MVRRRGEADDDSHEADIPDDMVEDFGAEEDLLGGLEETTHLVTVAQARSMREARTMKSILESAEIAAFVGQEDAAAVQPEGGAPGIPVLVPEGMVAEAEEILAEAAMDADDEPDEEEIEDADWDDDEEEDEDDYLDDLDDEDDDYDDEDDYLDDDEDDEDEDEEL